MVTPGPEHSQDYFQSLAAGKPKRARTRATFLDSAAELVVAHGIDGLTVQAIARQSGFAHGTFYNHFDDRDDVLIALVAEILEPIQEKIMLKAQRISPGVRRLILAITLTLSEGVANPDHAQVLAGAIGRYPEITDRIRPKLREDLRAGIAAGDICVKPSRLLDEQIGALIGLAFKELLRTKARAPIIRGTAEAVLRLLGQTPERASEVAGEVLEREC